jgi:hypothetical protein
MYLSGASAQRTYSSQPASWQLQYARRRHCIEAGGACCQVENCSFAVRAWHLRFWRPHASCGAALKALAGRKHLRACHLAGKPAGWLEPRTRAGCRHRGTRPGGSVHAQAVNTASHMVLGCVHVRRVQCWWQFVFRGEDGVLADSFGLQPGRLHAAPNRAPFQVQMHNQASVTGACAHGEECR